MARQFIYNSIPHQALLHANQLTLRAWNDYINILRIQTNDSSTYIETLNKWLFSESSIEENFYDGGFVPYIVSYLNSLKESKLDTSVFTSTIQSIRTELGTKATTTYIEGLLTLKADVSSVIALQQDKADTTYVNEVARDINQKITQLTNTKANKTYVDTELSKKASTSVVDGVTARVSNLESKDAQHDERLVNLETTKLNSSDFNTYKSVTNNAITLKLEKNLSNIGTLESSVGDSYTVVINDGVNSYKVTIAELKEIFGSLDTEQQLNHYKGVYKKLIDVPAGSEGDYCFIEKIENGDSVLTMYVWNKTDNIWEETNTSQYITSTVFSNFKQSIETGSTSVGLARDYTSNDGIGRKFTELETNKQDKLTFDETPTEGSTNPVTSGGLHKILKDGVGGIIDVESLPYTGWKGTPLPHNDTTIVENLYFNTSLSVDEVVNILAANFPADSNISYITMPGSKDPAGDPTDGFNSYLVGFVKELNTWAIANLVTLEILNGNVVEGAKLLFVSNPIPDLGINFKGWNPDIVYPISYNLPVYHSDWNNNPPVNGDLISDLVSTTPFVYSEEKINDKCVYRLRKDELKGTPLPYDATTVVENLYFNTSLSVDEVVSICEKYASKEYPFFITIPPGESVEQMQLDAYLIGYVPNLDIWAIANYAMLNILEGNVVEGAKLLFVSKPVPDLGITFTGWNPDIVYPIAYNFAVFVESIFTTGEINHIKGELISDLVSTTPYKTVSTYTYWVYKEKWVQLLTDEDEIKNEEEYVVIEKTGNFISQPESISFSSTEFDTIQSNDKVLVKLILDESMRAVFYKNGNGENSSEDYMYLSANWIAYTFHLIIMRNKTTKEITTFVTSTDLANETRVEGFSVTEQGEGPILLLHVLDKLGYSLYYPIYLKTVIEKDSIEIPTTGAVYNALAAKLTTSLSDVSSTTNVATTDNMLINKAGTMYKVTIQELQEVFGSANYKGNFVSVSALPATGTAGDYAFVKVVTDGDTDLIMYIWNDTDKHWEETGTSQYVKNATFQATMETKQDKLDVSLDEKGTMNIVIPESIEGAKTIKVNGVELVPVMEDITWENLKTLRDEGKLIPGKSYKIIDYTCTTSQANTISAHHDFDIIVTADSSNTLSETARASLKEGDTYYRTVDESSAIINTTNCKFIDESIVDDTSIRINVVGYQYTDHAGETYAPHSNDIFLYAVYDTNPHGYTSPVIYKTDPAYLEEGVDMQDPFFYVGTWELEGQVYDRWKKHENPYSLGYTWILTDSGDQYIITEKIVQGDVIVSELLTLEVCNLSAWGLKYCLDNDITRFAWADTTNGKGVIYYMKDEYGNEAWYDFKSIKQKVNIDSQNTNIRYTSFWQHTPHYSHYNGEEYFYTFHYERDTDLSVKALITAGYSPVEIWHPKNNKINPCRTKLSTDGDKQTEPLMIPYVLFFTSDKILSHFNGCFLWENTCVTGTEIICAGTMWNVELVGGSRNGLCGGFDNSHISTRSNIYYEGDTSTRCNINVHINSISYYNVLPYSTINGKLANPHNSPGTTYMYTEDFKDPELLIQESYEEEEE